MKGKLVMIDGLDGSGKSTVLNLIANWVKNKDLKLLDIREFSKEHKRIPNYEEISDYDVYLSSEPTYGKMGRAIKEELIDLNNNQNYSGLGIAQAFSLDREILYKKFIIPALEAGKVIFQENAITTTFIYQPVQIHIPLSYLMNLPGNKLALKYFPNVIIILKIEPETAMVRLGKVSDNVIFKEINFQRKISFRYGADWFQELFKKQGSKVIYCDVNPPKEKEDIKNEIIGYLNKLI